MHRVAFGFGAAFGSPPVAKLCRMLVGGRGKGIGLVAGVGFAYGVDS